MAGFSAMVSGKGGRGIFFLITFIYTEQISDERGGGGGGNWQYGVREGLL